MYVYMYATDDYKIIVAKDSRGTRSVEKGTGKGARMYPKTYPKKGEGGGKKEKKKSERAE